MNCRGCGPENVQIPWTWASASTTSRRKELGSMPQARALQGGEGEREVVIYVRGKSDGTEKLKKKKIYAARRSTGNRGSCLRRRTDSPWTLGSRVGTRPSWGNSHRLIPRGISATGCTPERGTHEQFRRDLAADQLTGDTGVEGRFTTVLACAIFRRRWLCVRCCRAFEHELSSAWACMRLPALADAEAGGMIT